MACRLCETPARIPRGRGQVFLWAPVDEVRRKLAETIRSWPENLTPQDGAFTGSTADFAAVLTRLEAAGPWSQVEREGIQLLFLPEGRSFSFASSLETRSLEDWSALGQAAFLADILDDGRLTTHVQPIVHLASGEPYGWECLTRGIDPDGSLVAPHQLFGAARRSGMTFPLDRQARMTALRNAHRYQLPGYLFINFIPTAIYDPNFCLRSTTQLSRDLGIAPDRIVFEVVESEEIADADHLSRIVAYYRDQGFRIALDDVGSGYSGLNALVRLRPDIIKIDAGLIQGVDRSPEKQAVVRSLTTAGRELGILVLAEGVETEHERRWVLEQGLDLAQGYLWGRPVPAESVPGTLSPRDD